MGNVIRSIGILRLGALGDICLTVPLVRLLQKHLPQTEIYWIISRPLYSLVEGLSNVKFIVIDKPKPLPIIGVVTFNSNLIILTRCSFRKRLCVLIFCVR